jgi:TRAP-type C4-dicarboxylate transport system substrate-binding protein
MIGLKLYQVTKYMTLTNQFSIVGVLMVSRTFMEKLNLENQALRYCFPDRKRNRGLLREESQGFLRQDGDRL